MSPELDRIAERARKEPKARFTALSHHLSEDFLRETWQGLNKRGAAGVDGVSMTAHGANLEENLGRLVANLKAHRYRAPRTPGSAGGGGPSVAWSSKGTGPKTGSANSSGPRPRIRGHRLPAQKSVSALAANGGPLGDKGYRSSGLAKADFAAAAQNPDRAGDGCGERLTGLCRAGAAQRARIPRRPVLGKRPAD